MYIITMTEREDILLRLSRLIGAYRNVGPSRVGALVGCDGRFFKDIDAVGDRPARSVRRPTFDRVVQEFFAQGDQEAELQLPVRPFMDRSTACVPKQQVGALMPYTSTPPVPYIPPPSHDLQVGFYNFIARPMLEALDRLVSMERPLANLDVMQAHWISQMPAGVEVPGTPAPPPNPPPAEENGRARV